MAEKIKTIFNKVNKFASKRNHVFTVFVIILLLIEALFAFLFLSEYWHVGILKQTEGYPWGCKCFSGEWKITLIPRFMLNRH